MQIDTGQPKDENYYKSLHNKYDNYKKSTFTEKDKDLPNILADLIREITEITERVNTDPKHIHLLFGQFLPEIFKNFFQRRFAAKESESQVKITHFINQWMVLRIPSMLNSLRYDFTERPKVNYHLAKELEILEMIVDDSQNIYSYQFSKTTQDVEDRLVLMFFEATSSLTPERDAQNQDIEMADLTQSRPEFQAKQGQVQQSIFFKHNIRLFSRLDGFNILMSILTPQPGYHKTTFQQHLGVLSIVTELKAHFGSEFMTPYLTKVATLIITYIKHELTQEDLRSVTRANLIYFIQRLEAIMIATLRPDDDKVVKVYQQTESMELDLALKCLQMPVLEKKFIGFGILDKKINSVRALSNSQAQSQKAQQNLGVMYNVRYLNAERLTEWIEKQKIFQLVFGESLHSEVIKKSQTLLYFLYSNGKIQERELDIIWDCATKKHEAYKVAILKALQFLCLKASLEHIQYLFNKIKNVQYHEIDKFYLEFLKRIGQRLSLNGNITEETINKEGRSHSLTQRNKDPFTSYHFKNKINEAFEGTDRMAQDNFALDDMAKTLTLQNKNKMDKRTRSLSWGDKENIKKPGSFNSKISDPKSQQLRFQGLNKRGSRAFKNEEEKKEETKFQNQRVPLHQPHHNSPIDQNPLDVPEEKEDQNTADIEGSLGEIDAQGFEGGPSNDLFEQEYRFQGEGQEGRRENTREPLEEEKADGSAQIQQQHNLRELLQDESLGIEDLDRRSLAYQVINFFWTLSLEDSVTDQQLSLQTHKMAIDQLVQLIHHYYPNALFLYIQKCVVCLQHNFSVLSVQSVLMKLISGIQFPLNFGKNLPKNRVDLLQVLEEELGLTNECLSTYIEFKRSSLAYIFDQMGSQEQEYENIETQSSLDNDDERSSMHSAQKGNVPTQENQNNASKPVQDLQQIQQESSGSLFLSPRARQEEETKQFPRAQSIQSETHYITSQFSKTADLAKTLKEVDMEDRSQKSSQPQIGQYNIGPQRSFGSTSKKQQFSLFSQAQRNENQVQNQISNELQSRGDMPPPAAPVNQNQQNNRDFLNQLITNHVYRYSYYQEMNHRLDFLKFLIGNCPGILKPQHIQVLWECLVINAYYEKERDMFFSWCTQILKAAQNLPGMKDIEQLGASIFKDDCLEMLFFDTLLKLDFRYISLVMYECFEKYLIYINEQYGQIVTNTFDSAFEVFETKLIGVEGLWEIALCVRNEQVYQKAAEFLHKLYKKMSPTLVDKLNQIKEDLLQTCMDQIKTGYNDIQGEIAEAYDVPISQFASSIEDPKNRIARSLHQLCKFIDEFEGLRDRGAKRQLGSAEQDVKLICKNNISQSNPPKLEMSIPVSTKIGAIREQVSQSLFPKMNPKQICLTKSGKDLEEDLKTLKDLGIQPDQQVIFFISQNNPQQVDEQIKLDDLVDNAQMNSALEDLKNFVGDIQSDHIMKLALKKCNLKLEEALIMLTDEQAVNDMQEEFRKQEEEKNQIALILEDPKEETKSEEAKLNLIISNRSEYFELLFELLNLGINEITTASWNLLVQIPVNKQLLQNIRTLNGIQVSGIGNWNQIIDSSNVYKMLYSLQIMNTLLYVNNESLNENEIQERFEWRQKFLELGGFDHLYHILITTDVDELLGNQQSTNLVQQTKLIGSTGKRKSKAQAKAKQQQPVQNENDQKDQQQILNNSAKCLGYLISIVRIFIQAALLSTDYEKLFTLIMRSATSPFRKHKNIKDALSSVPQNKIDQMIFKQDESHGNSSAHTPKFNSPISSDTASPHQCHTPQEEAGQKSSSNLLKDKSIDTFKNEQSSQSNRNQGQGLSYTQIDDFPKLVEQMREGIAQKILDRVINLNDLIQKLLQIIYKTVMFCESKEASQLVQNCLDLLLPCVVWKPWLLLKEIYQFENLESLLIRTLMFNQNETVRKSLEKTMKILCELDGSQSKNAENILGLESPKVYILKILLENLPEVNLKSDQCEEYFNLVTHLITISQSNFRNSVLESQEASKQKIFIEGGFSSNALLHWSIAQLMSRPTYEDKYSQYTDKVLAGYLQLTQAVIETNPELKKKQNQPRHLVKMIFDFLFQLPSLEDQQQKHQNVIIPGIPQDTYPKCKSKFTKKKAFNLLLALCNQCEENFIDLLTLLYQFHAQIQKSQEVVKLSEFDNEVGMRSTTGYVGLKNFSCTCYMNSLIQQLFMITNLRRGILEVDINDPIPEENLLYQVQQIFANLQESEKQYYTPQGFIDTFKFYGEPVNVRIQQDTHEFYNLLCDNLEEKLKGTPHERLLKDTIGGVICNETKSLEKEYPYVGEREEPFFAITLDIQNKKNIIEALDLYVKPDILEGENKYHCEKYDTRVKAHRRSYLKKLSNTVIINLKRFKFDYNTMQKVKVNDYCEFPMQINLKPWTKEGIREREMNENTQSKGALQQQKKSGEEELLENNENIKIEDEEMQADYESEEQEYNEDSSESLQPVEEDKRGGDALDEEMERFEEEFESGQNLNTGEYIDDEGCDDMMDMNENETDSKRGGKGKKQKKKLNEKKDRKKLKKKVRVKKISYKDDQYYQYQLVGVLVHSGSADAGHYYSFIKDRGSTKNHRWLEFNDTYVREFDLKNLEAECFGGNNDYRGQPSHSIFDDFNPADGRFFERCRNAYLLFYERVHPREQPKKIADEGKQSDGKRKFINGIERNLYEKIWEENAAFMKLKVFFDQEYFSFVREFVNQYNFKDVLYINQDQSKSFKVENWNRLSQRFVQEFPNLTIDYKKEFLEIEKQGKKQGEADIFQDFGKIQEDPGLFTLKLATILSQDIITKVKEVQSFVLWMKIMSQIYQKHAIACVWFIKYMTENRSVLEELLLSNNMFETISYLDFDCDHKMIERQELSTIHVSKASVIRFLDVYFNEMLDSARVHWRKFEEYFFVLSHSIQQRIQETKYIIQSNGIIKLIEFIMNNQPPFQNSIKLKMGERMIDPKFDWAMDILQILVRSCLTQGETNEAQHSPTSTNQNQKDMIQLPSEQAGYLLNKDCFSNFLTKFSTNQGFRDMMMHLSWGDQESSRLIVEHVMEIVKTNKGNLKDVDSYLRFLEVLLRLQDSQYLDRIVSVFQLDSFTNQSLFTYLRTYQNTNKLFVLKCLCFISDLFSNHPKVQDFMKSREQEANWIYEFLQSIYNNEFMIQNAQAHQMSLNESIQICYNQFLNIYEGPPLITESFDQNVEMKDDNFDIQDNYQQPREDFMDNIDPNTPPREDQDFDRAVNDQSFNADTDHKYDIDQDEEYHKNQERFH